jgi:hypothetical protein
MLSKHLLTISLLLRLMVISTAAHAGATITDKSYWPSEVRQSRTKPIWSPQGNFSSALAYDGSVSSLQPATNSNR